MEFELLPYLLKSGLLLTLLFVLYKLLLEREKMHRFNRFFLLFSLLFGLTVPLISINLNYDISALGIGGNINGSIESFSKPSDSLASVEVMNTDLKEDSFSLFIWSTYFIMMIALGLRMLKNLYAISTSVKNSILLNLGAGRLVLMKEDVIPHTFFNSIFVNEEKYKNGLIAKEVITHEMAHVSGRHSFDVLFVELLKVIFWFNPVFFFYKKAIQLNHEFIADEVITRDEQTIPFYQSLLLDHTRQFQAIPLTSNFNYSLTKKRLIMMTKKTSRVQALLRRLCFIPILILSVLAFSDVSYAQSIQKATVSELINELSSKVKAQGDLSDQEKKELKELMSELNQKIKVYEITKRPPPPPPQVLRVYADDEVDAIIKKISRLYNEAIAQYTKIEPTADNEVKLRATYENVVIHYHELIKAQSLKKRDGKAPPPPPMPAKPEDRIKNH